MAADVSPGAPDRGWLLGRGGTRIRRVEFESVMLRRLDFNSDDGAPSTQDGVILEDWWPPTRLWRCRWTRRDVGGCCGGGRIDWLGYWTCAEPLLMVPEAPPWFY